MLSDASTGQVEANSSLFVVVKTLSHTPKKVESCRLEGLSRSHRLVVIEAFKPKQINVTCLRLRAKES